MRRKPSFQLGLGAKGGFFWGTKDEASEERNIVLVIYATLCLLPEIFVPLQRIWTVRCVTVLV